MTSEKPRLLKMQRISRRLQAILNELDALELHIAAAHVQAGLDVLGQGDDEQPAPFTAKSSEK